VLRGCRLLFQVEHPVTEMITHVNLPAAQLQVAMGIPLGRIPDVRRHYGKSRFGAEPVDFEAEESVGPHGHVIAARITAENPEAGFQVLLLLLLRLLLLRLLAAAAADSCFLVLLLTRE